MYILIHDAPPSTFNFGFFIECFFYSHLELARHTPAHMNMAQRQPSSHAVLGRRTSRKTPEKSTGGSRTERHDAESPSEAHVYPSRGSSSSDTAYRRCRPRRSPFTTAVTLGAVLVGAAAASSGSRNPPPPPPPPPAVGNRYNNHNNGRQQDRWVGWTPPPPGPPPDPAVGGSGEEAGVAWGAGARDSSPQGGAASQQQGAGAICNDDSSSAPGMGMGPSQQHHDAAAGARETQQQVQERMSMMERQQQGRHEPSPPPANSQQQHQHQFSFQQGQQQHQQQQPPHPWGQNGAQQHEGQQDQPFDGAYSNGRNARARPGFAPPANGGMFQQPPAAGMGILGGAGAGAGANGGDGGATGGGGGGDGGGQWVPPSAASAGAVTPEVSRQG